jgi:pyocin large subunit-like protein
MSIDALGWVKKQKCNTPSTKLVLFILGNYADEKNSCYPSEKHLGKICGISDRQVRRALTWLTENNLITIQHRKGTSNRYFLSMDAHVHTSMDIHVLPVRTPVSAYTKDIQKNKTKKLNNKKRSKNELAG